MSAFRHHPKCHGERRSVSGALCTDADPLLLCDAYNAGAVSRQAELDAVYEERNRIVAALARLVVAHGGRAGLRDTAIDGWDPDWNGCCWIDLPTGQASWHYHRSQEHFFENLPCYEPEWDGHSTPEKYERLNKAWHAAARLGFVRSLMESPLTAQADSIDAAQHIGGFSDGGADE